MKPQAGILALLPTALVTILTLWSGTFHGAAAAKGAITTHSMILGFCLFGIAGLFDPLRLGRYGRWLVLAILALALISWWSSPVARAGTIGLILLPAFLLIPASTARCWALEPTRRIGPASVSALTLIVASLALIRWQTWSLPRTSLPLGHHNLLACWLILVLPLAVSGARRTGLPRWLALAAGATGLAALAATGSLLAGLAVTVQLAVACIWWPRLRRWAIPLASIIVVSTIPRLMGILQVADISMLARGSYLSAGWRGLLARPMTGWGPGAVPWTLAAFMEPVGGIHPASEVIGDLHSLPAQFAFELGLPGLLLSGAIAGIFLLRRWHETRSCSEPVSHQAALLGLIGGGVFALGAAPLSVPALPATAAIVAGASFAGAIPPPRRVRDISVWAYAITAAVLLTPLDRAHALYDRARLAPSASESQSLLKQARAIDPGFPLYLAREAWLAAGNQGVDREIAERARQAAELAPGLAPLWLEAGNLGNRAGAFWAPNALAKAHELDPLSPLVAFHLMTATTDVDAATKLGIDAVQGEPRLASAIWWLDSPELAHAVGSLTGVAIPPNPTDQDSRPMVLALSLDSRPALSFSLFAFRRSPWPGQLAPVELNVH